MRLRSTLAFGLSIALANAFKNTSPFFLFSTSQLQPSNLDDSTRITLASSIDTDIALSVSKCPSNSYIIVTQPGVSATDFARNRPAHHLSRRMRGEAEDVLYKAGVPEVVGSVGVDALVHFLERECGAVRQLENINAASGWIQIDPDVPRILVVDFPSPPAAGAERRDKLREHDAFLNELLGDLEGQYTVIYTTSPPGTEPQHPLGLYEMEEPFQSPLHTDMKRDMSVHARASGNNSMDSDAPLFEKYQFLSAGLFMGLTVSLLLLGIAYVGISALGSLEVSYAAFAKEMGPQAQKKQ